MQVLNSCCQLDALKTITLALFILAERKKSAHKLEPIAAWILWDVVGDRTFLHPWGDDKKLASKPNKSEYFEDARMVALRPRIHFMSCMLSKLLLNN